MGEDIVRHVEGEDWRLPHLRRIMAPISAKVRPLLMERSGAEITSLLSSMVGSPGCSVGATRSERSDGLAEPATLAIAADRRVRLIARRPPASRQGAR